MQKTKLWRRFAAFAAALLLMGLDQCFKRLAEVRLKPVGAKPLLPGILQLRYTENTGISFSALGESPAAMTAVIVLTALLMLGGFVLLFSGRLRGVAQYASVVLILAGGLGNLIDRAAQRYVVDYLEFLFVRFAVFNFADCLITAGAVWLAFCVLFSKKEKPFV
ncbi:MAG: signal peptidase II [Oscillospiraceae bacterium]|jgi:signal peptidase II|nr:signal peptidase II [Oscillospiraceae bacterium]